MPETDPSKAIIVVEPVKYTEMALSKQERVEKGLNYLEKAKKLKKSASTPHVSTEVKVEKAMGNSRYKDYSKDRDPPKYDPV